MTDHSHGTGTMPAVETITSALRILETIAKVNDCSVRLIYDHDVTPDTPPWLAEIGDSLGDGDDPLEALAIAAQLRAATARPHPVSGVPGP